MIYAYTHLPHRIENFHVNIVHFFEQLFANDLDAYDENILLKAAFIPIINHSRVLVADLAEITRQYHLLSNVDKQTLHDALSNNSEIESLCGNLGGFTPVKYSQITDEVFRKLLKDFLTELWEGYHFVNSIRDNFGTVQEHFNSFLSSTHQRALICPFCGLHKLKTSESINRDAYDHYIPKAFYPFISVNFKNLFPICHECNSDEKKTIDTLYRGAVRRQVFFPFDTTYQANQLSITVTPTEVYNPVNFKTLLFDINWSYVITLAGNADPRLTSWDEIFHIKRRYRENILVYQNEWYDEVLRIFKREKAKGTAFNIFRDEIIEDAEYQKLIAPLGMLRHSYFTFLFSIADIEMKLDEAAK